MMLEQLDVHMIVIHKQLDGLFSIVFPKRTHKWTWSSQTLHSSRVCSVLLNSHAACVCSLPTFHSTSNFRWTASQLVGMLFNERESAAGMNGMKVHENSIYFLLWSFSLVFPSFSPFDEESCSFHLLEKKWELFLFLKEVWSEWKTEKDAIFP